MYRSRAETDDESKRPAGQSSFPAERSSLSKPVY